MSHVFNLGSKFQTEKKLWWFHLLIGWEVQREDINP